MVFDHLQEVVTPGSKARGLFDEPARLFVRAQLSAEDVRSFPPMRVSRGGFSTPKPAHEGPRTIRKNGHHEA